MTVEIVCGEIFHSFKSLPMARTALHFSAHKERKVEIFAFLDQDHQREGAKRRNDIWQAKWGKCSFEDLRA